MLIKVLINGILTTCAASVPVAAGTYVYLCSEEAKALSHESLALKLLQKKPVKKVKKSPVPQKPPVGGGGSVGGAGPSGASQGIDVSQNTQNPPLSSSSVDSKSSSVTRSSPATITESNLPNPPTPAPAPTTVPQPVQPPQPTVGPNPVPSPALPAKSTTDGSSSASQQSNPPAHTPSSSLQNTIGTKGTKMTVAQLKTMIDVDPKLSQEDRNKWTRVIDELTKMSTKDKDALMSNFKIS